MASPEIAILINRVADGDRAAFAALYRATSPKLYAICLRILKDRGEAEDALQDIYVKIWRGAKSYNAAAGSPNTWMSSIARHRSIDSVRKRQPPTADLEDGYDVSDETIIDPETSTVLADEGRRIDRCMKELDPAHAGAVRRAYVEGLSYAEIAVELEAPLNTVRTWLRRSLMKLRECMLR
ncbi:MAG: RNA polymerase subunit sigma [Ancylobacter novellus]|uniref:RNA polymerase subunit sigma n=1 Tax=Ancylobacter novellus TaxID=921 RepID=A0A2W5KM08_ANCNO|nr:MAG: RNA polymerase subunit sigma [Ancylobacter novellus]